MAGGAVTAAGVFAARLARRSVIGIRGSDSSKFLQGLLTNDIHVLGKQPLLYAFILTGQVRETGGRRRAKEEMGMGGMRGEGRVVIGGAAVIEEDNHSCLASPPPSHPPPPSSCRAA